MNRNKKAKVVMIRSLALALSLAIGILISVQWRSVPARVTNPVAPYSSLKETRESLYDEQDQLKKEIKSLQEEIEKIQKDSRNSTLSKAEISDLYYKKTQAGLTKLSGPGLAVTYNDSKSETVTDDSIVHAADLRDTVNLLWASGAEAVAINGQRVVINTAIDCIVNTILVNNVRISNPFTIEAIGDQEFMYKQITDRHNLIDVWQRKKGQGLVFNIEKKTDLTLPIFDGSFEVKTNING